MYGEDAPLPLSFASLIATSDDDVTKRSLNSPSHHEEMESGVLGKELWSRKDKTMHSSKFQVASVVTAPYLHLRRCILFPRSWTFMTCDSLDIRRGSNPCQTLAFSDRHTSTPDRVGCLASAYSV